MTKIVYAKINNKLRFQLIVRCLPLTYPHLYQNYYQHRTFLPRGGQQTLWGWPVPPRPPLVVPLSLNAPSFLRVSWYWWSSLNQRRHACCGLQRWPEALSRGDEVVERGGQMERDSKGEERRGRGGHRAGGGAAPRQSSVGLHTEGRHWTQRTPDHHKGNTQNFVLFVQWFKRTCNHFFYSLTLLLTVARLLVLKNCHQDLVKLSSVHFEPERHGLIVYVFVRYIFREESI